MIHLNQWKIIYHDQCYVALRTGRQRANRRRDQLHQIAFNNKVSFPYDDTIYDHRGMCDAALICVADFVRWPTSDNLSKNQLKPQQHHNDITTTLQLIVHAYSAKIV